MTKILTKLFAHRGFTRSNSLVNSLGPKNLGPNSEENSITSLHEAYKKGFRGIEFDVWCLDNKLVLCHDMPEKSKIANLPQFKDYLVFQNEMEYWIDFKNLDEANVFKALEILQKDVVLAKIDMSKVLFAPFITDFNKALIIYNAILEIFPAAQIMAVCDKLDSQNFSSYHKLLQKNNIKFLSILHKIIDEDFVKIFSDINIFAWTVNDIERLKQLQKLGIKHFTSDTITPEIL